jgi:NAD(P)-dependent dehydrogenase (short-subunit alcohol dehydrogenase family)
MNKEIAELFNLKGRVAVITGGAGNLGLDAASVLAAAGCDLAITARELARAQKAAEELRTKYPVDVLPLQLDQTSVAQVSAAAARAQEWKQRVDILVNNAGGGSGRTVARLFERDPQATDELVRVNLTGMIWCCQAFGRLMAERRSGKIINIASVAGLVGRDRRIYDRAGMNGQPVDYAAAKAGVIGLTRDLAGYLSPLGVCVNAISPGGFNGPARNVPEQFVRDYSDRSPPGRMGRDGIDLKGAVLFLASPASDYVTGQNLVVDGGFSIWK